MNNPTRPIPVFQPLIQFCYANGPQGVFKQQQILHLSCMRHILHQVQILGGTMAFVSIVRTCNVMSISPNKGTDTSTAAMILILSYSCYQASEIDLPTIDTTWRKAETVLQHLASFSASGRNTLNFLQAMRARFVSHLKLHLPVTETFNGTSTQIHAEQGQPHLSQPVVDTWQPLSWDESLSTNELGFLGPFDISEMQSWFPQAGIS